MPNAPVHSSAARKRPALGPARGGPARSLNLRRLRVVEPYLPIAWLSPYETLFPLVSKLEEALRQVERGTVVTVTA